MEAGAAGGALDDNSDKRCLPVMIKDTAQHGQTQPEEAVVQSVSIQPHES